MAKKPEIDVQVQLLFQEAVKKLTNAVANAAAINMDRNQKMQHANLMTALTMYLPQLVEGQLKGGKVELPQTLINAMTGRNQTIQTTHNLVQNISNNMRSGGLAGGANGDPE